MKRLQVEQPWEKYLAIALFILLVTASVIFFAGASECSKYHPEPRTEPTACGTK